MCQLGVNVACVDINIENCNNTVRLASKSLGIAKMYICNITHKDEVSTSLINITINKYIIFILCNKYIKFDLIVNKI